VPLSGRWRALIVDDNADAAQVLAEGLRRQGHDVRVAHDASSALVEAERMLPDVVLLDIALPDGDGYQVARRLRQRPSLADTKLVALSGYGHEEHYARSRAAGFDRHLVKPVDLERLASLLAAWAPRSAHPETIRPPIGGAAGTG
jgi:two-component system CheB/CheR fusion protein